MIPKMSTHNCILIQLQFIRIVRNRNGARTAMKMHSIGRGEGDAAAISPSLLNVHLIKCSNH